jgi:hypothetical protein
MNAETQTAIAAGCLVAALVFAFWRFARSRQASLGSILVGQEPGEAFVAHIERTGRRAAARHLEQKFGDAYTKTLLGNMGEASPPAPASGPAPAPNSPGGPPPASPSAPTV